MIKPGKVHCVLFIMAFILPSFPLSGQEEKSNTSGKQEKQTIKGNKTEYSVRVAEVNGTCEVWIPQPEQKKNSEKEGKNKKWKKATEGMVLPPGSGVSTGLKGKLILNLAGEGSLIVKNLTQGQIGRLRREGNALTGKFAVKTGNVQVQIKEQEVDANFEVSTPRVTAAVKGSTVQVRARGDMGDSLYVQEGHMEARNPTYNQTITSGQKAVQRQGKKEFHRTIEVESMERVADIMPSGIIEADSPQRLKEMAEKVVDLVTTDAGGTQGGYTNTFSSYTRFERVHKTFHLIIQDAPSGAPVEKMHGELHATNGNVRSMENWFHKWVCGSPRRSKLNKQRAHRGWHEHTLDVPSTSAGMKET